MSTEIVTVEAPAAGADESQTAQPEQEKAGVAQPQDSAEKEGAEGAADGEDKGLTDEQRAIRKLQRRIDRLTAKRGGTERENELLRQQNDQLARQIEAASQRSETGDEHRPKSRQFSEADIERLANARAQELQKQTTLGQRVGKVLEAGKSLQGFSAAVDSVAEVVPFVDRQGRPTAFIEAVLDSDDPAALLKHLGDNPDDAEDLADLTPSQLGRRLAKLEDQIKAGAKKQTSAAPVPLKPVQSKNTGTGEPDPDKDASAWIKWRNQQERQKRA